MIVPFVLALGISVFPFTQQGHASTTGRLAVLIRDWEKAEAQVKDVRKVVRQTYVDRAWRTEEVFQVVVLGKKPNSFRVEKCDVRGKPISLFVNGESVVRSFDYQTKTQDTYDQRTHSPSAPWVPRLADGSLWPMLQGFYLGFDVNQFAKAYELGLAGEDEFFAYITVKPRKSSKESPKRSWLQSLFEFHFQTMQIALRKSDFQPREIRWIEPSGNFYRYEYLEIKTNLNPPVTEQMIEADLPSGWKKTGPKQP